MKIKKQEIKFAYTGISELKRGGEGETPRDSRSSDLFFIMSSSEETGKNFNFRNYSLAAQSVFVSPRRRFPSCTSEAVGLTNMFPKATTSVDCKFVFNLIPSS